LAHKTVRELRIVSFVRFPTFVILKTLSCHAECQHEKQRRDSTEGTERRDEWYALQDRADQEINIGVAFELDDEGKGEESDEVVLCCGDVVRKNWLCWRSRNLYQKL
jgi:hypothetical protein